ncbi:LPPG:FO 2-phospho-L-lactate transferase [Methanohalophilus levihalophilus]|uniref:2-phospho-L-lactate transferase n=1 Tax=Methanohalophilus levihalophilus TaxID=1431282 RepID=UPI001AE7EDF5|nr:2-phospho-L-lactate transferase [Methanohalophilus levihalophilus]MBP2030853.1 LPPG:FO 2-phospho-L-lactate transferase [Methanohalophilus levihalophilus]
MIIFSGGTGTPKLLDGLKRVLPHEDIHVVVNTAEDIWVGGNLITPDIDTVLYLFSEKIDRSKWWGVDGDTFQTHQSMLDAGFDEGMMIGDVDRATHIMRSELLRSGLSLTESIRELCRHFGISAGIYPMTDDPVSTYISIPEGKLHFQDFWVGKRGEPDVLDVTIDGIRNASISPSVLELLEKEDNVLIGPSNPITSIGPIIALPGMVDILKGKNVVAISPIIGNEPVSGPAGKLMAAKGYDVSSKGVAECYADFLDVMVIDSTDTSDIKDIESVGCEVRQENTLMKSVEVSENLSESVIRIFKELNIYGIN